MRRLAPVASIELQTLHQLRLGAFSAWTGPDVRDACIHHGCTAADSTRLGHWVWSCTAAEKVWQRWLEPWAEFHGVGWRSLRQQVFEFRLEDLPRHATARLVDDSGGSGERTNHQLDVLFEVVHHFWTGITIAVIHGLWVWRVGLMWDTEHGQEHGAVRLEARIQSRVRAMGLTFPLGVRVARSTAARAVTRTTLGRRGSASASQSSYQRDGALDFLRRGIAG